MCGLACALPRCTGRLGTNLESSLQLGAEVTKIFFKHTDARVDEFANQRDTASGSEN